MPTARLLLLLPLALAACSTPREQCLSRANGNLRTLEALADETRATLARGYAVEDYQEVREVRRRCEITLADGSEETIPCDRTVVRDRSRPVAVDLSAERQKLAQLERRIAAAREQAAANRQACIAAYPAT
ncbi:hypothetical protein [Histidinibacterium aquaticum]|uniref:DUF1090 family protein n=1 Tax=Histidinibacterium aquaticum TaxID=2613962 RepID=A0A5J5GB79_9RHOB|nr:hypothetical protein [Histidinibacterium aquaticum]KAA9005251.1 hypothetical protein F3S47_18285 [Histidinibacterium aquaticum]